MSLEDKRRRSQTQRHGLLVEYLNETHSIGSIETESELVFIRDRGREEMGIDCLLIQKLAFLLVNAKFWQ